MVTAPTEFLSEVDLQHRRRANLRHLLNELQRGGALPWELLGHLIGDVPGERLMVLALGASISDAFAREIEWSMHRPNGWLDGRHADPLDA